MNFIDTEWRNSSFQRLGGLGRPKEKSIGVAHKKSTKKDRLAFGRPPLDYLLPRILEALLLFGPRDQTKIERSQAAREV